jgi:hypothetical protein
MRKTTESCNLEHHIHKSWEKYFLLQSFRQQYAFQEKVASA